MLVQKEAKHARGHPETPRTGTPARNGCAVPKRRLNGAYKGLWAHLPPSPPLPRSGGRGFLSYLLPVLIQRSASADYYEHKGAVNPQVLAHWRLSFPPLRRGEGWWFALRAPARGRKKCRRRLPLERICVQYGFVFLLPQKNNIRIQRSQALRVFRAAALKRFWNLGSPQGLATLWGEEDAPQRRGLPAA